MFINAYFREVSLPFFLFLIFEYSRIFIYVNYISKRSVMRRGRNAEDIERGRLEHAFLVARNTLCVLVVVAAVTVLVSTFWMPVLRIHGSSMTPTVEPGQVVIARKTDNLKSGDVVALWYGNKVLVKRVIATAGQWVDIDEDGNVYVDNTLLDEPYLSEKSLGQCNIELPIQVPEDRYFVMGDHRSVSQDSRNQAIGCIKKDQMIGRITVSLWPISNFGSVR